MPPRAVHLDPNNADAYLFLSFALAVSERGEEALHNIIKAMRLTPHPSGGLCYFVLEEYDLAIAACRRGVEMTDGSIPNHYWLCLIYTLLGRDEDARVEREELMALSGGRKPVIQHIWLNEDLGFRMHGLARLAGLE
jgi:tetratricopeptide (TPR) repeat protein